MLLNLTAAIPSSPCASQFNPTLADDGRGGDEHLHKEQWPAAAHQQQHLQHLLGVGVDADGTNDGLGKWYLDKRTRKRTYVSLTGKTMTGAPAVTQSRIDRNSQHHPNNSARAELRYLMRPGGQAPQSLEDVLGAGAAVGGAGGGNDTSCSFVQSDPHDLTTWGVPVRVANRYAQQGIKHMFPWQIECLGTDGGRVLRGGNLVYSAPTSGGKTLVAEMLILRRLGGIPQGQRGTVFFVVPFVALAEEKAEYLRTVFQDLHLAVRGGWLLFIS